MVVLGGLGGIKFFLRRTDTKFLRIFSPRFEASIKVSVIFKNQEIVVVDKPHGLSVHNNEDSQNLLSVLESQLNIDKLYPVHRLDKETSGVQLLALSQASAKKYSDEFQNKLVKKSYLGILRGQLKESKGLWTWKLTDKSEGRKNPAGLTAARVACETHFHVLQKSKFFSYCDFNLITGRQHQIRKHAALSNHSLVGDPRYCDKKYNKKIYGLYKTKRLFLHCTKIEILGMVFESQAPNEFGKLLLDSPQ